MRLRNFAPVVLSIPLLGAAPMPQNMQVWEKPIAPGLVYRIEIDPRVPRQIHALRLTPGSPNLRWHTQVAGGTIEEADTFKGRLGPADFAAKEGALAMINGDFFSFDHGAPLGLTVRDGELINTPARPRAVFAWGLKESTVALGNATATLTTEAGAGPLDGMNQPVGENGIALYTAAQGRLSPRAGALVVTLNVPNVIWAPTTAATAKVSAIPSESGPLTVEKGKAVLVATGSKRKRLEELRAGDTVTIRLDTPGFDWKKFENIISGGPFLLRDGKIDIDGAEQGFNTAFANNRHPRTAIGRTAEGDIWMVAIDGRQTQSAGATLQEEALIMQRLGCVDAINLDGGGSTAINLRGLTVNRPSDGRERQVANGIVIYGPKPVAPAGKLRLVADGKISPSGTLDARVDLDGQPVSPIDILWTARGAAWVDPGGRVTFIQPGTATLYARVYGQTLEAAVEWKR
jgi:hypothetical protein